MKKSKQIILGIDPGIARLGYAFLEFENKDSFKLLNCGIINTSKIHDLGHRLKEIRQDLHELITLYKPDIMAIELLYFAQNRRTAITVAHARGVIIEIASCFNLKILEFTPTQVKQIITGNGKAEKKDIQNEIMRFFNLNKRIEPDDACDAVAIAVCCTRNIL